MIVLDILRKDKNQTMYTMHLKTVSQLTSTVSVTKCAALLMCRISTVRTQPRVATWSIHLQKCANQVKQYTSISLSA